MNQSPDFSKGLLPVIIQHARLGTVLMLGYMNAEAYEQTQQTGRVCYFSRSKNRLWVKGESSGHYLEVVRMDLDCDADTLLVQALPAGPVCHTGSSSCFGNQTTEYGWLQQLESVIQQRQHQPRPGSYTHALFEAGIDRMAQKVGEEAVETLIAAKNSDLNKLHEETADLLYHVLVLLAAKRTSLQGVLAVLQARHQHD